MNTRNFTQELKDLINQEQFHLDDVDTVMDLVKRGANPDIENDKKKSLLSLLFSVEADIEACELVEKYGVNPVSAFGLPENHQIDLSLEDFSTKKILGSGVQSSVFLGEYNNNAVAIKAYKMREESYCDKFNDFKYETENLIKLAETKETDTNTVGFYGFYIGQSFYQQMLVPVYCIIMENIPNGSFDILGKTRLGTDDTNKIISGLINGMRFIHQHHLVHGDLKSENVLLANNYEVKIADFGYARYEGYPATSGTPLTQAPELLTDESYNSRKSDIFSLGVVLYEVITQKKIKVPKYISMDKEKPKLLLAEFLQANNRYIIPANQSTFKNEMLIYSCWNTDPRKRSAAKNLFIKLKLNENKIYQKYLRSELPDILSIACKYGHTDIVEDLLNTNHAVNEISQEGSTPLLAACASSYTFGKPELFLLLMKSGASLYNKNSQGYTALDVSFINKNETAIIELLSFLVRMPSIDEPVMSLKSIDLARKWVAKKSLQKQYNDDFFEKITAATKHEIKLNKKIIANVKSEADLQAAISAIGFFPSKSAGGSYTSTHVRRTLHWYSTHQRPIHYVPSVFGLRSVTNAIYEIKSAETKEELFEAVSEIDKFPSAHGKFDKNQIKTNLEKYFKDEIKSDALPRVYGLRDKAMQIKQDEKKMQNGFKK